ncbi:MAG: hypothetical protein ACE5LC_04275 [Candidatus Aminicenantales bacterium]
MKKYGIVFILMLLLFPAFCFSDIFSFKAAYFIPRAESDLWIQEFTNMSLTKNDYHNTSFGFAYEYFVTREISFVFSADPYYARKIGTYLDFVGYSFNEGDFAFPTIYEGDFYISHLFDVSMTPVSASIKLTPFGRRGRLIPYVGAGGVIFLWNVRLQGDIVDMEDVWEYYDADYDEWIEIYKIKTANVRDDNKISFGYLVFGGFMWPVGKRLSFDLEFKYIVGQGKLSNFLDYEPFDLSGYRLSIGLNYWF